MAGNWAKRQNYDADDSPLGPLYRSPFSSCESVFGNQTVNGRVVQMWYPSCTRLAKPGASCDGTAYGFDYPALCQQIDLAARLLVVDCVFGGFAFALSWILCVWSVLAYRPRKHQGEETPEGRVAHAYPFRYDPATPLYVFALVAAASAFLAAIVGGNALVNLSAPTGDFSSGASTAPAKDAGWWFDEEYSFASASWIVAVFGAWSVSWVWGRGRGVGRGD